MLCDSAASSRRFFFIVHFMLYVHCMRGSLPGIHVFYLTVGKEEPPIGGFVRINGMVWSSHALVQHPVCIPATAQKHRLSTYTYIHSVSVQMHQCNESIQAHCTPPHKCTYSIHFNGQICTKVHKQIDKVQRQLIPYVMEL